MSRKLSGKVALVTGGSRGIGAATARALAEQGATVAISYAQAADKAEALVRELERKEVKAAAFKADQGDAKQVEALVQAVVKRFGRLDILVNNAGVFVAGDITDPDVAKFDRQFAVNVGGLAAAVRAAAKVMGNGARIIAIGSVLGEQVPFPGVSDYSATKAAVPATRLGSRPGPQGHHGQYRPVHRHRQTRTAATSRPCRNRSPRWGVMADPKRWPPPLSSWPVRKLRTSRAQHSMWTAGLRHRSANLKRQRGTEFPGWRFAFVRVLASGQWLDKNDCTATFHCSGCVSRYG